MNHLNDSGTSKSPSRWIFWVGMSLVGFGSLTAASAEYLHTLKLQFPLGIGAVALGFGIAGADELWHGERGDAEDLLGLSVSFTMMAAAVYLWPISGVLASIIGTLAFVLILLAGL